MAPPPVAVSQGLAQGVADRLNRALDDVSSIVQNPASVVADDNLTAAPLIPLRETARAACRQWARVGVGQSSLTDGVMGPLCSDYLDDIGEAPLPGDIAPPFEGGQCAVLYRSVGSLDFTTLICSTGTNAPGSVDATTDFVLQGPLSNLRTVLSGAGPCGPTTVTLIVDTAAGPAQLAFFQNPSNNSVRNPSFNGSFEPAPGQPNDCGNPPPDYVPPTSAPGLPPYSPTVPLPGFDSPVNVDFDFNPDGTISVSLPDLDVSADIDLNPTFGGGGGANDPAPGDQGAPGSGGSTGAGGEAEGEAPPNSVLTGLKVNSIVTTREVSEFAAGIVRGVAYIYMGGDAGLDLVPAGAVLRAGQFVNAPLDYLTKWRVNANVGFEIDVTPYYREIEA